MSHIAMNISHKETLLQSQKYKRYPLNYPFELYSMDGKGNLMKVIPLSIVRRNPELECILVQSTSSENRN